MEERIILDKDEKAKRSFINFPSKSERIEELIENYVNENEICFTKNTASSIEENLVNSVARKFNELTKDEQKKVLERINGIDYITVSGIQEYGNLKKNPIAKNADEIIKRYSTHDFGQIYSIIAGLKTTMNKGNCELEDVLELLSFKKERAFVLGLVERFAIKEAKKKLFKAIQEQERNQKNIYAIAVFLNKQERELKRELQIYENMVQDTYSYMIELELNYIGLELMISNASKRLEIGDKSVAFFEDSYRRDLQNAIDAMQRKKQVMDTSRILALQSLAEINMLIYSNGVIIEKIDEVQNIIIPIWKCQYATTIGKIKYQEMINTQKALRSKIGNTEIYEATIAIKDMLAVRKYIDDTLDNLLIARKHVENEAINAMRKVSNKHNRQP